MIFRKIHTEMRYMLQCLCEVDSKMSLTMYEVYTEMRYSMKLLGFLNEFYFEM